MEFQGGFNQVLNLVEERQSKQWVGIPQKYSKLEEYIPYYEKGTYLLLSAHSGVGKTIFTISDWLVYPYLFSRDSGYKLKIFYFSLEKKNVIVDAHVLSNLYFQYCNNKVSKQDIFSNRLDANTLENMKELSKLYHDYKDVITVVDNVYSPNGIRDYMRKYYKDKGKIVKDEKGGSKFITTDDTHVLVITDTLNAMSSLEGKSKSETLNYYSRDVCKNEFCDLYGATTINVQQQDKTAEKTEFNFRSEINFQATRPSRNSLGESKLTFNDADFFITLYAPFVYRVPKYPFEGKDGWDITKLKRKFTLLSLEKNRDGDSPFEMGLYSDLEVNYFEEMPHYSEFMTNPSLYQFYQKK